MLYNYYHVIEKGKRYDIVTADGLRPSDKIIRTVPKIIWWEFFEVYHDELPHYSHVELGHWLDEFKKKWYKEHGL